MHAEVMAKNDHIIIISVPEPQLYDESKWYVHDNPYSLHGYKITLFEHIVVRLNKTYCSSNFWFVGNYCTKQFKHDEEGALAFDSNHSS